MRRLIFALSIVLIVRGMPHGALAARHSQLPTVKDVALAFGKALQYNDGAAAVSLLAPGIRSHTTVNQLPAMLGVQQAPLGVQVIRWAFAMGTGDATLGLRYRDRMVAEHLVFQLCAEGWRITAIQPEDQTSLQRGAELAVVVFCDAIVKGDPRAMRKQLTLKLLAHRSYMQIMALLGLSVPIRSYLVESYQGTATGAEVVVALRSDTTTVRDLFVVINDRDGWRIASIAASR
jgi:hypothetical protein